MPVRIDYQQLSVEQIEKKQKEQSTAFEALVIYLLSCLERTSKQAAGSRNVLCSSV